MVQRVLVAAPRGFCAGVEMAIKALTWMVRTLEPPVYCFHQIVHNASVVDAFRQAGVVFVDDVSQVPPGAPLMLSAHGSSPEVVEAARARAAVVVDAVCPLVTKVHHEVKRLDRQGFDIIYVGHQGHDEAVGTVAEAPDAITLVEPEAGGLQDFSPRQPDKVALVAQTTLGLYEWEGVLARAQAQFPALWTARKSDLCYATTNRQSAIGELAARSDLVLVVGSENSSNTQALVRVARQSGCPAYRVNGPGDIAPQWLEGVQVVGVTAGASAPEQLVRDVIERLAPQEGVEAVHITDEDEYFPLPPQLRSFLGALQAAVEGGYSARHPGSPGLLQKDREWGATEALELLGAG
ncbi:MAG: 4-hydroxy-3-methylbut-2-enyl diphosphate reductase [Actinomycetota bacterium]|nr:4-hydroxy-3-methylbut-2-enyl diphosphate reductase [Actinomycetota bacterium]